MKALMVSDSHGDFSSLQKIYNREKPLELLIHLCDGVLEALLLQKKTGIKVEAVNGNNDPLKNGYLTKSSGLNRSFFDLK